MQLGRTFVTAAVSASFLAVSAFGVVTSTTTTDTSATGLDSFIATDDIIAGQIGNELDANGWHPANTDPLDQAPALTDGMGVRATGLSGLLNDFPGAGNPAKIMEYTFDPTNVGSIQILSGNLGKDGRVFSTTVVEYSTDGGQNYEQLGYFESDLPGTLNTEDPQRGATLVTIFDDASTTLLAGINAIKFSFYAVDNTGGQYRDPFDGVNPFTGVDDGLTAAFVSPLIFEVDVFVPEPASLGMLAALGLLALRRR